MPIFQLGFSPCPNDTFIFDALVHQRFEIPFQVAPQLLDVEKLNQLATAYSMEITKMSFAAYPAVSDKYQILSAGSALGRNCGPLLICKKKPDPSDWSRCRVAIPGKMTTANLLLSIFFPQLTNKVEMIFSDIEDAVMNEVVDFGLIIHENRFTYAQKGLIKVADLGECWENEHGLPIPLGCIAVHRNLEESLKLAVDKAIRQSVEWAFLHPDDAKEYIQQHAQEMSQEVQRNHIDLYVNQFSVDLGEEGRSAIRFLFEEGKKVGLLEEVTEPIFV